MNDWNEILVLLYGYDLLTHLFLLIKDETNNKKRINVVD